MLPKYFFVISIVVFVFLISMYHSSHSSYRFSETPLYRTPISPRKDSSHPFVLRSEQLIGDREKYDREENEDREEDRKKYETIL